MPAKTTPARARPAKNSPARAKPVTTRRPAKAAKADKTSPAKPDRTEQAEPVVEIYTDGACSGNPGPGGWGAVLRYGPHTKEIYGGESSGTTNNRMELMAAIRGLESLTRPSTVRLHTDSVYLRSGITSWLPKWKRNGWRTADKKPVKNADLWRRLEDAVERHHVIWLWVKGHAGNPGNERADALANRGMREAIAAGQQLRQGSEYLGQDLHRPHENVRLGSRVTEPRVGAGRLAQERYPARAQRQAARRGKGPVIVTPCLNRRRS